MTTGGKLGLEVSLEKEINYHGEEMPIKININNTTGKTVNSIRVCNGLTKYLLAGPPLLTLG